MDKNDLAGRLHRQKVLKDLFFNNKTLKHASMAYCMLGESGAAQISRGIGFSSVFVSLNLAGNQLGNQGAEFFSDCI